MAFRQKIRKGIILSSFFLFPAIFFYFSPFLIVQATLNGTINGSFIVFSLLFLCALILGRAFCGWVCPGAGCQEIISTIRTKNVTKGNYIKWLIWLPWISTIIIFAIRRGGYERIDFFYSTLHGLSVTSVGALIIYLIVLSLIAIPSFLAGKRSFCHHICWMAPFMILGKRIGNIFNWPSLQLVALGAKCTHCHKCTRNCPMSLPVEKMVEKNKIGNSECILCGSCIDGCDSGVIKFRFTQRRV
jgi:ferredoxin-type protein NapH